MAKARRKAKGEGRKAVGIRMASVRRVCLGLPGVTEEVKWGEDLVWSVGGKMFAACHESDSGGAELPLGFKCCDEDFEKLTKKTGIIPAPYAARFGWVSVREASALTQREVERLVREAYRLVREKLPRRVREKLGQ